MSISTMVGLGMKRQNEASTATAEAASSETPSADLKETVQDALSKLTAFVPSEVVGLYIAGLGTLTPATSVGKWCIFGICMLLIPAFMWVSYLIQKKQADKENPTPRRWFILLVFAWVAFIAWSAALPSTPFLDIDPRATVIAGVAVLALSSLMSKLARALDIAPQSP
jgi:threonine/homoserine efflux transporter RhtA